VKDQPLKKLQQWMQAVITHPAGVEAGLSTTEAQSHIATSSSDVETIIEPSRRQSSIERLEVYANAYYARLIECLQAEFPIFRQTVGDELFSEFAVDYLRRYPSQSYTLGELGARFVSFLTDTRPATPDAADWSDFLIDLARLERTLSEVFDGPGCETKPPLNHEEILAIDPERWPKVRLTTVPCLRLLSLRFPLNDYYTAIKSGGEAPLPQAADSWLAITRRNYVVRRYSLTRPQFILLTELQRGKTVGEAIAAAATAYSGDVDQLAADLRDWFRTWSAAPMFESAQVS
jgi:hypothetical protein